MKNIFLDNALTIKQMKEELLLTPHLLNLVQGN